MTSTLPQWLAQARSCRRTGGRWQPIPKVEPKGFTEPPPGRGLARYENQQIDWQSCGHGFFCGTLLVPLDYANPDGTAITLMVAKRPGDGDKQIGSLIINPGGPGGSGVGYVGYFNAAGLENYDIVGWDPRGVGRSTPVTCFGKDDLDHYFSMDSSPDNAAELQARIDEQTASDDPASIGSGALLEHISTMETVRDLDLLRGLVGDSKLNYFGASYGTRIGALYAEMFPQRVGRMILTAQSTSIQPPRSRQVDGFERALASFRLVVCGGELSDRVSAGRRDLLIKNFLDQLDQQPLAVSGRAYPQPAAGSRSCSYSMYGGTSQLADASRCARRGDV